MSLDGRTVKHVQLHTTIFIQGFGQMGPTITAANVDGRNRAKGLTMTIDGNFLLMEFVDDKSKLPYEVAIPLSDVISLNLDVAPRK